MARLETQINQIYLIHPETKKSSLVLYEEALSPTLHLFYLAEITGMQRKSEANNLKKISEIILESFRLNKKLSGENLFEAALAQINQNLADLAHDGHKAWVGKVSCLIALKSLDTVFVANDGQTGAWLKRQNEIMEILPPEKRGTHPLKTFNNFTQGKLEENDELVICTSNIFNFVSFELFGRLLQQNDLAKASTQISKILQDSLNEEQGFCAFLLKFDKQTLAEQALVEQPAIYAPLPEDLPTEEIIEKKKWFRLPGFKFQPLFNISFLKKYQWKFFKNLSLAGKFFLISFIIFFVLFLIKIGSVMINLSEKKTAQKIETQVNLINKELSDAQSALIYQNDDEAMKIVAAAQKDYDALKKMDSVKAGTVADKFEYVKNQVNHISVVNDPKLFFELKHHPIYLAKTGTTLLFANNDSNSLSYYTGTLKDYFLLNSLKSNITGIASSPTAGVVVTAGSMIYRINQSLKEFEPVINLPNTDLDDIKVVGQNIYALDKTTNQILKVSFAKNKYSSTGVANAQDGVRDYDLDKDVYLLYADHLNKITGGQAIAIPFPTLAEPVTNATKLIVATNIYILEPSKKRVVILNKNGKLLNQIFFPAISNVFDFEIDEAQRNILLLEDNKLYKITF